MSFVRVTLLSLALAGLAELAACGSNGGALNSTLANQSQQVLAYLNSSPRQGLFNIHYEEVTSADVVTIAAVPLGRPALALPNPVPSSWQIVTIHGLGSLTSPEADPSVALDSRYSFAISAIIPSSVSGSSACLNSAYGAVKNKLQLDLNGDGNLVPIRIFPNNLGYSEGAEASDAFSLAFQGPSVTASAFLHEFAGVIFDKLDLCQEGSPSPGSIALPPEPESPIK